MKVNITTKLLSEINILSSEYDIEVGGYLVGEVKNNEIYLQELLIPDQRISPTIVNISPQDQINLLKKYGRKRVSKIIGHWHSHHKMGCFWSTTDIEMMNNTMSHKPYFVFIVSSLGEHLVRVSLNNPIRHDIDNVKLHQKTLSLDLLRNKMKKLMKINSFFKFEFDDNDNNYNDNENGVNIDES